VLGDLFKAEDGSPPDRFGRLDRLRNLTRSHWGRYVALDRDSDGRIRAVLRDPSGAFEVAIWRSLDVCLVSSGTPDWLMQAAPPAVDIQWSGVSALIGNPLAALTQPPLEGLTALDAGEMLDLDIGKREPVWTPVQSLGPDLWDATAAGDGLRSRVDHCIGSLMSVTAAPGAELSGGLDSAIVASAMGEDRRRVALWLNAYSERAETDERAKANLIAAHFGLNLSYGHRVEQALEAEILDLTAGDVRPGLNGADPTFDALVASACRDAGVTSLFTGKGGDALFYQGASTAILGELWRRRGPLALTSPVLPGLARWMRRSAWSIIRDNLGPRSSSIAAAPDASLALAEPASEVSHPWMAGAAALAPSKRLQLLALISNLAYVTACRRTGVVDLVHPLMSQPLLEWSMRVPSPVLTGGRMDRFLARTTFSDRLPDPIAWRMSKGDYTATFEREAAASLPFLRAHLLDGLLVQHGVLDRSRTETLLDRDRLMWAGGSGALTNAALVESWLRRWKARSDRRPEAAALRSPQAR
jgi:asparagine synthase (glutamine-hydrolysing)